MGAVHSQHIRQAPGHDRGVDLIRISAAAVISGNKLDIREILSVKGFVKALHRFPVGLALLRVLNGVDPDRQVLFPRIVARYITRLRILLLAPGQAGGGKEDSGRAYPWFFHVLSSFFSCFKTVFVTG